MSYGKRGKPLEMMIEYTNKTYKQKKWALIDKVPTPWNVRYDKKRKRVISAFPERKGTVDFVGVSQGRAVAFDAKSTTSRTSFPLKNVTSEQVDYLKKHQEQGGISFFIVEFSKLGEIYLITFNDFYRWWQGARQGGRKSIPHNFFHVYCEQIKSGRGVVLDYLKTLDLV